MATVSTVFDQSILPLQQQLFEKTSLCSDTVKVVLEYLDINPFRCAEWAQYAGIDFGVEFELTKEFYDFWYGPDPLEPEKQAFETHIPPVFCPISLNLKVLNFFFGNRLENSLAYEQNKQKAADRTYWLVMRKDIFALGKRASEQIDLIKELNRKTGANYEVRPSIVDLVCVVFARYAFKGERHLGDDTGEEKRKTYSRCLETILEYPLVVGGFAPDTGMKFNIACRFLDSYIGTALLRKFYLI